MKGTSYLQKRHNCNGMRPMRCHALLLPSQWRIHPSLLHEQTLEVNIPFPLAALVGPGLAPHQVLMAPLEMLEAIVSYRRGLPCAAVLLVSPHHPQQSHHQNSRPSLKQEVAPQPARLLIMRYGSNKKMCGETRNVDVVLFRLHLEIPKAAAAQPAGRLRFPTLSREVPSIKQPPEG